MDNTLTGVKWSFDSQGSTQGNSEISQIDQMLAEYDAAGKSCNSCCGGCQSGQAVAQYKHVMNKDLDEN